MTLKVIVQKKLSLVLVLRTTDVSGKHFKAGQVGRWARPNGISDSDFRFSIFHLLDSDVCYRTLPHHYPI